MSVAQPTNVSNNTIQKYLSLVKFSHTIFALPFAMVGFSLAVLYENQAFKWSLLLCVILCMVFARNAAMGFNRYLDRDIDALNPRTASREIPAGLIKPQHALAFVIINAILFVGTTYFINPLCFYLSPIAIFVVLFYSYTKRITALCHIVLGIGLGLAPIGAFLSVTGYFHIVPVLLGLAVMCWTGGFDIIYALQDEAFDKGKGLNSIPAKFGTKGALNISTTLHIITALLIIAIGLLTQMHFIYWIGAAIFIGLLIYQHSIVKPNDLSKVGLAFGTTNGIASVIYAVFTITALFLG